jgi:tripartite-type tricarboxylate transporter receptor subunit TctC
MLCSVGGAALFGLLAGATAHPAHGQTEGVAKFYKGKTVQVLIGVSPGGEIDLHSRLSARFIGRHIPGNPTVIAQNMPGATGVVMQNHFANVAPQDGTVIAMAMNATPLHQVLGIGNIQFDMAKFQWIGSISPSVETMALWHTTGVKTLEDARGKDIAIGSVGRTGITYIFPSLLNAFAGTKFRMITGYRGGGEVNLALERGEIGGRNNTWSSWKATKPQWLAKKQIVLLAYGGPKPADLIGVPDIESLAKTEEDRRVLRLFVAGSKLGRPLAVMAGVPADRVEALRAAFDATMTDPDFLKDAAAANVEVDPVPGKAMQAIVDDVLSAPPAVKQRAKAILD